MHQIQLAQKGDGSDHTFGHAQPPCNVQLRNKPVARGVRHIGRNQACMAEAIHIHHSVSQAWRWWDENTQKCLEQLLIIRISVHLFGDHLVACPGGSSDNAAKSDCKCLPLLHCSQECPVKGFRPCPVDHATWLPKLPASSPVAASKMVHGSQQSGARRPLTPRRVAQQELDHPCPENSSGWAAPTAWPPSSSLSPLSPSMNQCCQSTLTATLPDHTLAVSSMVAALSSRWPLAPSNR